MLQNTPKPPPSTTMHDRLYEVFVLKLFAFCVCFKRFLFLLIVTVWIELKWTFKTSDFIEVDSLPNKWIRNDRNMETYT